MRKSSRRRAAWGAGAAALVLGLLGAGPASGAGALYITNYMSSSLSGFQLAADGTPSLLAAPLGTGAGGGSPSGLAITPDGRHLYTANGGGSVSRFDIAADGSLTLVGTPVSTGGGAPIGIAVTPDGRHAYVGLSGANTLARFDIAADGSLTQVGTPVGTGGLFPTGVAISRDGRHAYVANYNSNTLTRFDIALDGFLTKVGVPTATGASGAEGVVLTPDGGHAYIANRTSGNVTRFDIASDGSPTQVGASVATGGTGPVPIAASPDGRHVYTGESPKTVSRFDIAPDGSLTQVGGPVGSGATSQANGIAIAPDGRRMYTANGSGDVSRFDIAADGGLTLVGPPVPGGGVGPSNFSAAILPDQGPTAALAPAAGVAGTATRFDGSASSDAGGAVARYDWDFGDGTLLPDGGPLPAHTYAKAGTYQATLTVTDDAGCSTALVFTGQTAMCNASPAATATEAVVIAAAPSPPPPVLAPALSSFALSPSSFRAASSGPSTVKARATASAKVKTGTVISYRDSLVARTTFTVLQTRAGVLKGKTCVKPPKKPGTLKRCKRVVTLGTFAHDDVAGANRLRFTGRIRGATLAPGAYQLKAVPRDSAGKSGKAVTRSFRVTR